MTDPFESALTPIRSGVTPTTGGRLNPVRAAELRRQLHELHLARARAIADCREFVVTP